MNVEPGLVNRFSRLFEGREDCYGNGTTGRCAVRYDAVTNESDRLPLTRQVWENHLSGTQPMGVYPRGIDDMTHWGCSDFDKGYEALYAVINVKRALSILDIPAWIETSRSKGYHLWVFLPGGVWVNAADMRRAFLLAHHLAEVPATEVNPKQDTGPGIGNFVRLPYPGLSLDGKQVISEDTEAGLIPLTLRQFLTLAEVAPADPFKIQEAANVYRESVEVIREPVEVHPYDGKLDDLVRRLHNGFSTLLFRDGPLVDPIKGKPDRSLGLWNVVRDAHSSGLSPAEAMALVTDANVRWGKGEGFEPELLKMVAKLYG